MIAWQLVSACNWSDNDEEVLVKMDDGAVATSRHFGNGDWFVTFNGEAVRSATADEYIKIKPRFWMNLKPF